MHASIIFKIMRKEKCDILHFLPSEKWIFVRKVIISMILSTDLTRHFDLVGEFRAKIINHPTRPLDTFDHKLNVLQIAIKASDIGHAGKIRDLHEKWSSLAI